MFAEVVVNFMRKMLTYFDDGSITIEDIRNYIKMVEEVGSPTTASLLEISLEQMLSK